MVNGEIKLVVVSGSNEFRVGGCSDVDPVAAERVSDSAMEILIEVEEN